MIDRLLRVVRAAPASCAWLALLLVTTVLQHVGTTEQVAAWLENSSTDLRHLGSDPVTVLVTSLGWLDGAWWLPYAAMFAIVVIPMERRLGVRRWAAMGLAGHLIGTAVSQGALWVAIALGLTSSSQMTMRDIGVSYALMAFVGGAAQYVSPRHRRAFVSVVVAVAATALVVDPGVTNLGHLTALVTGLVVGPLLVPRAQLSASRFFSTSTSKSGAGQRRSRWDSASMRISVTASRANHLWSAGTTYQGAPSMSVRSRTA